ncbi:MAG: lytic murein transglycosylase B [Wenzhouxiangellaceae bacterium]|nr:lytic murein transglycosylase B [Wenzhouxiangellaceae bacterium]
MRKLIFLTGFTILLAGWAAAQPHPGAAEFAERAAAEHAIDIEHIRSTLAQARYQQSIIDAITRPAEAKPWHEYRKIFVHQPRIDGGVEFWRANRSLVDKVASEFGVAAEFVLAIIGVETNYGLITGNYRVLDALVTLGFYYPKRGDFFASELGHFFRLSQEEGLPLDEIKGSYAGAMGLGQFIPSSYRAYAVDFDQSGARDLWRSLPDALGSVANYLKVHGWQDRQPTVLRVTHMPDGIDESFPVKPAHTLEKLRALGIEFQAGELAPETPATVIELEAADGPEFWIGLNNFYVITRYNRSPLYAMAVTQLADELKRQAQKMLAQAE